jgi:hypothetical protein
MRTGKTAMTDPFFTKSACDRCGGSLAVRTMSWFNKDAICMTCSAKESEIKKALRAQSCADAMEGCGFIPVKGRDYT